MSVEPVRWIHGRLEILDQRLLPYREKYLVCRTVDQVVDAIKTLAVRGAPLLGVTGAYALALAKDRRAAAKKLIASRPTAVNLRWAVERTLRAADPLTEARLIHAEDAAMCDAIARHGAPLLKGKRVLTICNTGALATGGIGTAFGVLLRARATVYALETRPLRQGARLTMWEAEKCGLKAFVLPDGAAAAALREKKITRPSPAPTASRGTATPPTRWHFSLALACHALGVPFYRGAQLDHRPGVPQRLISDRRARCDRSLDRFPA